MSDTTSKGCPIPGCGGEGVKQPHDSDNTPIVKCMKCFFWTWPGWWDSLLRPSAELGEITRRMRKLYTPGNQPIESIGVVLSNLADEIDSIAAPETPRAANAYRLIGGPESRTLHLDWAECVGPDYDIKRGRPSWVEEFDIVGTGAAPETQRPGEPNCINEDRACFAPNYCDYHRRKVQAEMESQPPEPVKALRKVSAVLRDAATKLAGKHLMEPMFLDTQADAIDGCIAGLSLETQQPGELPCDDCAICDEPAKYCSARCASDAEPHQAPESVAEVVRLKAKLDTIRRLCDDEDVTSG